MDLYKCALWAHSMYRVLEYYFELGFCVLLSMSLPPSLCRLSFPLDLLVSCLLRPNWADSVYSASSRILLHGIRVWGLRTSAPDKQSNPNHGWRRKEEKNGQRNGYLAFDREARQKQLRFLVVQDGPVPTRAWILELYWRSEWSSTRGNAQGLLNLGNGSK